MTDTLDIPAALDRRNPKAPDEIKPAAPAVTDGGDNDGLVQSTANSGASTPVVSATVKPKSWRDVVSVHPACEMFQPLAAGELVALGEDIKANGLQAPIIFWQSAVSGDWLLLDGRSRLDAMKAVGRTVDLSALRARQMS
jgi:hypothetical protein